MLTKHKTNMFDAATDGLSPVWYRSKGERFSIRLITTLEWAVVASVPFVEALEVLRAELNGWIKWVPRLGRLLMLGLFIALIGYNLSWLNGWKGTGDVLRFFLVNSLWAIIPYVLFVCVYSGRVAGVRELARMIGALRSGLSLGDVLSRKPIRGFPEHFVGLIVDAERRGMLDAVIPLVARQMRYETAVRMDRMSYWSVAGVQTFLVLLIVWPMSQFIMPVFVAMANDFGESRMQALAQRMNDIQYWIHCALGVALAVFLLMRFDSIRNRVSPLIPIIRTDWKRRQLRQLAQSVSLYLQCGLDVVAAIQASLHTVRDPQLQATLSGFLGRVRSGEPWGRAWEGMQLQAYAYPWLIVNSAHREDPVSGFTHMADWIHSDISRTTRLVQRWFSPCVVVVLSGVVAAIAVAFHMCLHTMWQTVLVP